MADEVRNRLKFYCSKERFDEIYDKYIIRNSVDDADVFVLRKLTPISDDVKVDEGRTNNWGAKYAYDTAAFDNTIWFSTIWDEVTDLIDVLHEQNPDVEFDYDFAGEPNGVNAGHVEHRNDKCTYVFYHDYSKEAYELSFELWDSAENYKFDETKCTYVEVE